jgi:hypothetical protein
MSFKRQILANLCNILGWHTNQNIIVFESDDWGSNRMPSKEIFTHLYNNRIVEEDNAFHFNKYDSLECNNDLEGLFEVLSSFKDQRGNHPVFTGVNVLANPDFNRIKEDKFEKYYYEPVSVTLEKKGPGFNKVLDLWKEGAEKRLFIPQFHGREHLNINAWMRALKQNRPKTRTAFDYEVYCINPLTVGECRIQYLAAFDLDYAEDLMDQHSIIKDGIGLFSNLLGYTPSFFVPPNGPFNLDLEYTLSESGIKYLMLNKFQKEPLGNNKYKIRLHYLGQKNRHNQFYLSRNASFEPSSSDEDWVDRCLFQIQKAFQWRKPATIATHRVNYAGFLYPKNRDNGLTQLKRLIQKIVTTWPDVEFISSNQLGDIIRESK